MTNVHPLKSVISIGNVDDTSLALPSANQQRSGAQRVLEQVQSIRRTRTKSSSRSGSTSQSPTSPIFDAVFFESGKSLSEVTDGGAHFGNGLLKSSYADKSIYRQSTANASKGSAWKRNTVTYDKSYPLISSMTLGQANTSRSEPELLWQRSAPKSSATPQRTAASKRVYRAQRSHSQFISSALAPQRQNQPLAPPLSPRRQPQPRSPTLAPPPFVAPPLSPSVAPPLSPSVAPPPPAYAANGVHFKSSRQVQTSKTQTSKTKESKPVTAETPEKSKSGVNGSNGVAAITMKEAVEYLSNKDESYQHCGASYVQHNTFVDDKAKEEVSKLNGIRKLVDLLHGSSARVSCTAAAALRNLTFKNDPNKEEVQRCGGIPDAVAALRDTNSVELQKQLTGLLWNLSSAENVKAELLKSALPVLVEHVVLPYTTGPNRRDPASQDPDVFYHTTGCLRNLSSAKQSSRQAMRKCRGLIDSLSNHVTDQLDAGKADDESVENCVCILHNLTFQLEAEAPALFSKITALANIAQRNASNTSNTSNNSSSCFSPQNKPSGQETHFDFPVLEDSQPAGAGWLIHSRTLQSYLGLLGTSQREGTLEACCGALQNLTSHDSIVSAVMSQNVVQKLNGLQTISPLIQSNKVNLQRNIVHLVGNLSKNPNLHTAIARKALPELLAVLRKGTGDGNESDDTLAVACLTATTVTSKRPDISKSQLDHALIQSLSNLSHNQYFPKSSKAAAVFLHSLWLNKDLQSHLRKLGMNKGSFVNAVTSSAHRSIQVVD